MEKPSLTISVQGSIIDHLGIQMYQNPASAIAELIANAWDADAENVIVRIPEPISSDSTIEILDDGNGMTASECQDRFLRVGASRRACGKDRSDRKGRPVLGKKGIGKFAGFGIASEITIDTTSVENGERTVFVLDIDKLHEDSIDDKPVNVLNYLPPQDERKRNHGTHIMLKRLNAHKTLGIERFKTSLSRKFSLQRGASQFSITVNDDPIEDGFDSINREFDFPANYDDREKPTGMRVEEGWGIETLPNGKSIRWRILFLKSPIDDEELKGVSIFCRGKVAQKPFFFNLTGGLGGQHGLEYLAGRVEADYIDESATDLIAPERQRIDWENDETKPLETWGQDRIKTLIRIWKDRRGKNRIDAINGKLEPYSSRLRRLPGHEQRTVRSALYKIAEIETLSDDQLTSLCDGMLTAWEGGRLRNLIDDIAESEDPSAESMLSLLSEAQVLSALNTAEVVKTKLESIEMLEKAIREKRLENPLRDYIAEHPDFIDPKWETFKRETSLKHIADAAEAASGRVAVDLYGEKRVDLLFRGGDTLLVAEFMRPGLATDRGHLERLEIYCDYIKQQIRANSGLGVTSVIGLFVGDGLGNDPMITQKIETLRTIGITAKTWGTLLSDAKRAWKDFLDILKTRAPEDERLANLCEEKARDLNGQGE